MRRTFTLTVRNRSAYATRDLARLIRAALRDKALTARRYAFDVLPGRYMDWSGGNLNGHAGFAMHGGRRAAVVAPAPAEGESALGPHAFARFCWTLDHECLHLAGFRHGEMRWHERLEEEALAYGPPALPKWAAGQTPPAARPAKAPAKPSGAARLAHAEAMLARAETRVRRAEALAARWRRRIRSLRAAAARLRAV